MSSLRIKLDDGSTVEGSLEGPISPDVDEIIAAGPVRIALDADEVEGHELSSIVRLTIAGSDDTEGHALSLRLPNAKAARDLERRLLATGVLVGVVVVGAVSANAIATPRTTSAGAISAVSGADLSHDSRPPAAAVSGADLSHDSRPPAAAVSGADLSHDSRPPAAAVSGADLSHDSRPYAAAVSGADLSHDSRPPAAASDEPSGSEPGNLRDR